MTPICHKAHIKPTGLMGLLLFLMIVRVACCENEEGHVPEVMESLPSELNSTHSRDIPVNVSELIKQIIYHKNSEQIKTNQSKAGTSGKASSVTSSISSKPLRRKPVSEIGRSHESEHGLVFDSNYFATLNAANHRPVLSPSSMSFASSAPVPSTDKNSTKNLFYYSPETYGKLSHRNHQNTAFTFTYSDPTTPANGGKQSSLDNSSIIPVDYDVANQSNPMTTSSLPSIDSEKSKQTGSVPNKGVILTIDKSKPKIKELSRESGQNTTTTTLGTKRKNKPSMSSSNERPSSSGMNLEPFDDTYYELADGNSGGNDKYYYQDPFMMSMTRSNGPNPGKLSKPFRYPDNIPSSGSAPPSPLTDYLEEDYDSSDSYPEFKNYPLVKSALSSPKYTGPLPYRFPPYTSYYPTRFYAPYDGDSSPGKSSGSGVNSWSGLAGFLLGILPLGILMASMVPAFVSVPVATATAGVGRKKRSTDHDSYGLQSRVAEYEATMNKSNECLQRIVCRAMKRGNSEGVRERLTWAVEKLNSTEFFQSLKLTQVLKQVENGNCDAFKCNSKLYRDWP